MCPIVQKNKELRYIADLAKMCRNNRTKSPFGDFVILKIKPNYLTLIFMFKPTWLHVGLNPPGSTILLEPKSATPTLRFPLRNLRLLKFNLRTSRRSSNFSMRTHGSHRSRLRSLLSSTENYRFLTLSQAGAKVLKNQRPLPRSLILFS
jgi:hypothetical protein